jgi:hypothetical protein
MLKDHESPSKKNPVYMEHTPNRCCWAFDSEFLASGRTNAPEDVHTIQFSDGDTSVVLENDIELKEWLANHRNIKTLYGFVVLPDLGSVEEWLGADNVQIRKRGTQTIGRICYGSTKMNVYDVQPLAQSFGFHRLTDIGDFFKTPKLPKPAWLGLRRWQTQSEREAFLEYARVDAVITAKFATWLITHIKADPARYTSAGTLVKDYFKLPKRLHGRPIKLSPLEAMVKKATFAGRSEGFRTGFIPNVTYNDVSSLYPCCVVASQCLRIAGAEPCAPSEIIVSPDLNDLRYGWLEGVFETKNDLWGLPLRGKNNFYAVGNQIYGIYHTFDIAAAKAKVLHVLRAWKPIFRERDFYTHKYAELLTMRIDKPLDAESKAYTKAILNALSGKLGQAKPIAATSNFYAYNTLLAHSHLVMSLLFDRCPSEVLAMDTDSIFSHCDMTGKWFDVTDGQFTIPIKTGVKGRGDLAFFRSKRYILKGETTIFGAHGWRYFLEDYLKMFNGDVTDLTTRIDIKHTLLTRQKEALKMAKGRWRTKPTTLDLAKLKQLLTADPKRNRETYDSYPLVMERRSIPSQAWNYEELLNSNENPLEYPRPIHAITEKEGFEEALDKFKSGKVVLEPVGR